MESIIFIQWTQKQKELNSLKNASTKSWFRRKTQNIANNQTNIVLKPENHFFSSPNLVEVTDLVICSFLFEFRVDSYLNLPEQITS